jgi:NADPH:quinone reductase-like Zn-dependent oxidoreductase
MAVGANVSGFAPGQKVVTFGFDGSHAELRAAPAATTWVLPAGLDTKVAATVPCGLGTAAHALALGRFEKGQTILVQGATGGVGLAAVQLAHRTGARVIGTGLRADWLDAVKPYGLDDAIVAGEAPVHKQVRALVGRKGVDLLVDCVGGEAFGDGLLAVREGGHAVLVGVMGSGRAQIDATHLVMTRKTIAGCFLGLVMHEPAIHAMIADLLATVARGELNVPISAVYPLSDVVGAHQRAEEGGNVGRVVMVA